tara:strand:+ start:1288 stop:2451 length:1164 start_codon:yes stop_codon:yes gene_type:complete
MSIDQEWEDFVLSGYTDNAVDYEETDTQYQSPNLKNDILSVAPTATDIYISTKSKIAYLNQHIDINGIFWNIPVINYSTPSCGIIKKQIKINSDTQENLNLIQEKIKKYTYCDEQIITHVENPEGRIKFKDSRKISIGISKKDIMCIRGKKKSAFYNCFVLIIRIKVDEIFKEFHVKIFNTGKLEIPGIQSDDTFEALLTEVINIVQPHVNDKLGYKENTTETILINSNFNCGFLINRETLFDILKYKYNIQAIYDPCSYPGIKCKYYYNPEINNTTSFKITEENKKLYKNIVEVSFMIFRTGNVLIVGKCEEYMLRIIYGFVKDMLSTEYANICQQTFVNYNEDEVIAVKNKKKKNRKKIFQLKFKYVSSFNYKSIHSTTSLFIYL